MSESVDGNSGFKAKTGKENLPPMDEWVRKLGMNSTANLKIPKKLADQVIGQEDAVVVIKKAAEQRRHVMLIGEPGTGKSMLANSMVGYLSSSELEDIIIYHNPDDANEPRVRIVPGGKGKEIVQAQKMEARRRQEQKGSMMLMIIFMIIGLSCVFAIQPKEGGGWSIDGTIIFFGIIAAAMIFMAMRYVLMKEDKAMVPKLLMSHKPGDKPPFIDATAAHAGAMLGDVKHDPFQSGGLETPSHDRVEAGAIHKAHKGVLFIDEINMLKMETQQSLLTALQEHKFSIVGQSERSSGAMVKTEPVPCDFIMVAAGNLDAMQGMHPALRSRIRGYGYEIFMKTTMKDTENNRKRLVRFVAQEVSKDKKIPHFDKFAVGEIMREAQRRAGRQGQLTLRLRELGGLIRVSGDIAKEQGKAVVGAEDVILARSIAKPLEQQIADRYIERRKEYSTFVTEGAEIGMVNGLAVMGGESGMAEYSGIVLPIVAEVTPAHSKDQGKMVATGKLGEIAKEAVQNVSALIKKYTGQDISRQDVHIQFLGTYDGVEGDSASISVAAAVISALEGVEVDQSVGMTGSLSVRGKVLPVGGVTAKIEAASEMGLTKVLIPKANMQDVVLQDKYVGKIEIVPVDNLGEVLYHTLVKSPKKEGLLAKLSQFLPKPGTGITNLVKEPRPLMLTPQE